MTDKIIYCVRLTPRWMRSIIGMISFMLIIATSPIWFPLFFAYALFNAFMEDDDIAF